MNVFSEVAIAGIGETNVGKIPGITGIQFQVEAARLALEDAGLSKDDVRVELTDEGLVLEGERRSELEEEREGMYRSERSYGSFCRVIPLPEGCDASGAEAHFENGVLEITLPLPEAATRARRIEIQEGKPSPKASAMH